VTKPESEGPPLHEHPNEEQFSLVISGQLLLQEIMRAEKILGHFGDLCGGARLRLANAVTRIIGLPL
jgi:hypothetical protein